MKMNSIAMVGGIGLCLVAGYFLNKAFNRTSGIKKNITYINRILSHRYDRDPEIHYRVWCGTDGFARIRLYAADSSADVDMHLFAHSCYEALHRAEQQVLRWI